MGYSWPHVFWGCHAPPQFSTLGHLLLNSAARANIMNQVRNTMLMPGKQSQTAWAVVCIQARLEAGSHRKWPLKHPCGYFPQYEGVCVTVRRTKTLYGYNIFYFPKPGRTYISLDPYMQREIGKARIITVQMRNVRPKEGKWGLAFSSTSSVYINRMAFESQWLVPSSSGSIRGDEFGPGLRVDRHCGSGSTTCPRSSKTA